MRRLPDETLAKWQRRRDFLFVLAKLGLTAAVASCGDLILLNQDGHGLNPRGAGPYGPYGCDPYDPYCDPYGTYGPYGPYGCDPYDPYCDAYGPYHPYGDPYHPYGMAPRGWFSRDPRAPMPDRTARSFFERLTDRHRA